MLNHVESESFLVTSSQIFGALELTKEGLAQHDAFLLRLRHPVFNARLHGKLLARREDPSIWHLWGSMFRTGSNALRRVHIRGWCGGALRNSSCDVLALRHLIHAAGIQTY